MNFTEEQLEAITKSGTSIIVSAGAGSGKTAVLSERVIEKIKNNIHVDELLILTFTNKAALEMKERIEKKIKKLGNIEELKRLDKAYITTFDAFCLSIVKKYHYKKNISPNIKIIDSSFMDLKRNEILEEILEKKYEEKDNNFETLIYNFCGKDDKNIKDAILSFLNNISLKINKKEFLDNYIDYYYSNEYIESLLLELKEMKNEKLNDLNNLLEEIKLYDLGDYYEKLLDSLIPIIEESGTFTKLPQLPNNTEECVKNIKDDIKKLVEEILDIEKNLISGKNDYLNTKETVKVIIEIIKKLDKNLTEYKEKNDLYEFIDIELIACQLLENEEIKNEIKNTFKEIMIDEYQDTSDIQEYFINLIQNNNVYMVGDIKQSIYRFRNANPYIFKNKYEEFKNGINGYKIDLNQNFRSRKEVLNPINQVFNKLMDIEFGGASYKEEHQLIPGNKTFKKLKKEENNPVILTYEKNKEIKNEELEAKIIASDIIAKINNKYQIIDKETEELRQIEYKDFAILLDRVSYSDTYKKVFEEYKIPLHVIKDTSILENNLLKLFKNIINYILEIDKSKLDYLKVSILRSFLFELTDDEILKLKEKNYKYNPLEIKKEDILTSISSVTPYQFIKDIITIFEIEEKLEKIGDIKENLEIINYILNTAETLESLGYTPYDLANYLEKINNLNFDLKIKALENTTNSVNLMTIHKSKGLEFPICYFAGLYKDFNISDLKDPFTFHNDYGFITPFYDDGIRETFLKKLLKNKYLKEEIGEKIRLFYVALTRAKETLVFVSPILKEDITNKDKFRSFYDFLLNVKDIISPWIIEAKVIMPNNSKIKNEISIKRINTKEIIINKKPNLDETSYSKDVKEILSKEQKQNIEFGLNLHELFETANLKENTNNKYLKKFKENPLFKNINEAKIYQEYEFYYEDDKTHNGIIDLILEYEDHIDIIDYKLKNIDDSAYKNQLDGYKNYIKRISNKEINLYLYSIIDGSVKKL